MRIEVFSPEVKISPSLFIFKNSNFSVHDDFLRELKVNEDEKQEILNNIMEEIRFYFQIEKVKSFVKYFDFLFVKGDRKDRVLNLKNERIRNLKVLNPLVGKDKDFNSLICCFDKKEEKVSPYSFRSFEKKISKEGFFQEEDLKKLDLGEIDIQNFCFGFLLNEINIKLSKLDLLSSIEILKEGNLIFKTKNLEIVSYSHFTREKKSDKK